MKKLFIVFAALIAVNIFVGCASTGAKVETSALQPVDDDFDFIYEVVNNTSGQLIVAGYVNNDKGKELTRSYDILIEQGDIFQFKFNLKKMRDNYGAMSFFGCYFEPKGRWRCSGWMNDFGDYNKNCKHAVIVSDASDLNYCMDAENRWMVYSSNILETEETDYDFIYEVVNNSSGNLTVENYISIEPEHGLESAISNPIVIKKGDKYQFKYNLTKLKELYGNNKFIGCYFYPENRWLCGGWQSGLNESNKKHTVIIKDASDDNYCMDAISKWDNL